MNIESEVDKELSGVNDPKDIDPVAFALIHGVTVRQREMTKSAIIVGNKEKGIICYSSQLDIKQMRFAICHELGHWFNHHGDVCIGQYVGEIQNRNMREKIADQFAYNFLMPESLFLPHIKRSKKPTFSQIEELSVNFNTELIRTAIRFVELDVNASCLICYEGNESNFYRKSNSWPSSLTPKFTEEIFSDIIQSVSMEKSVVSIPVNASKYFDGIDVANLNINRESIFNPVVNESSVSVLTLYSYDPVP